MKSIDNGREPLICATTGELAAAFAAWEQNFRDDPDAYMTDEQKAAEAVETYGEACSRHLVKVLWKLAGA